MKLNEVKTYNNKPTVEKWLNHHNIRNYVINDTDLTVDVYTSVNLNDIREKGEPIPIKFRNVYGDFSTGYGHLPSLHGCPDHIEGDFDCSSNSLSSIKYFPKTIYGDVHMYLNNIATLHNIHKYAKEITGELKTDVIDDSLLGLFFIKRLNVLDFGFEDYKNEKNMNIANIVTEYLQRQDVHGCQEALLEAGFPKAARF